MLRALFDEARNCTVVWRRRLVFYWHAGEKDNLGFFAMLALPIVAISSIIFFAYAERPRVDPVRPEAPRISAAQRRALDLHCLAENIYFEARGEPLKGQYAVAEVTLNRLRARDFPKTICEVVHDTRWDPLRRRFVAHFSWTELQFRSEPTGPAWELALAVATTVYDRANLPVVPDALYFHATTVHPYWASTKRVVAKIGKHVFYR